MFRSSTCVYQTKSSTQYARSNRISKAAISGDEEVTEVTATVVGVTEGVDEAEDRVVEEGGEVEARRASLLLTTAAGFETNP